MTEHVTGELNADEIARLVREAGVFCEVDMTGGNTATLFAGAEHQVPGEDLTRRVLMAGPGVYGDKPSAFYLEEFAITPDADDFADDEVMVPEMLGARTERDVADLIIAQARRGWPYVRLDFDTVEAMGFDGTLMSRPRRAA